MCLGGDSCWVVCSCCLRVKFVVYWGKIGFSLCADEEGMDGTKVGEKEREEMNRGRETERIFMS